MVGLDADKLSLLFVEFVDGKVTSAHAGLEKQPEHGELAADGGGEAAEFEGIREIRGQYQRQREQGNQDKCDDSHGGGLSRLRLARPQRPLYVCEATNQSQLAF